MPRKLLLLILSLLVTLSASAQSALPVGSPWVFAGFKGNSQDGVYMAVSLDGYRWTLVNQGKPVISQTQPGELMRDPFLQRTPDDTFVMVWTWGWNGTTIGLSTSDDLTHWTPHRQLAVMAKEPTALNAWAPALYWDKSFRRWRLFWSSTIPGRFPGDDAGDTQDGHPLNHRIFSTTTRDFTKFAPARVFFDPGYSVIDATMIYAPELKGPAWHLIYKDERKTPLQKHLLTATASSIEGPFTHISQPISEPWSEGAAIIRVPGGYLAYYDHYTRPQHYGALFSTDLFSWTDADAKVTFPEGMRHGSFLQITREEYEHLAQMK